MKKAILFSALLIIITLLSSCTNSERYHFSHISSIFIVSDSKTGKVYFTLPNNHEVTWNPIKKTWTSDTLKSENKAVASDYKAPQQQESQRDSQTQFQQPTQTQSKEASYTIQQLGQAAKVKFPKEYGKMDDKSAGMAFVSNNPSVQSFISDYQPDDQQQSREQYTLKQFGQLVKAKYPKEYGSMSDSMAGAKLISKYPQYNTYLKK